MIIIHYIKLEGTVKSFTEIKLEDRGNDTPNAFPWEEFLNLAMHKLIIHWKIPNASKAFNDEKEKIINDYKVNNYLFTIVFTIYSKLIKPR